MNHETDLVTTASPGQTVLKSKFPVEAAVIAGLQGLDLDELLSEAASDARHIHWRARNVRLARQPPERARMIVMFWRNGIEQWPYLRRSFEYGEMPVANELGIGGSARPSIHSPRGETDSTPHLSIAPREQAFVNFSPVTKIEISRPSVHQPPKYILAAPSRPPVLPIR